MDRIQLRIMVWLLDFNVWASLTVYRLQSVCTVPASCLALLTSSSYFNNGAQINTPMDVEIAQSIEANLEPWSNAWKDLQPGGPVRADAYQKVLPQYNETVQAYAVRQVRPLLKY